MWQMTIKQRRQHTELVAKLDRLHRSPYAKPPPGYVFGENTDDDEKYNASLEELKKLLQALHELEIAVKDR